MELIKPTYKLYNQKNMELLKSMEDNSLDAVVTDCPYGLGKEPDATETLKAWIETGYHEIKGSGFMGKTWDSFVPQPVFWKEVFRVLKPGGYVLAFFGTRTYDWGVMAIRLAGFEIRDCIQWIYGSGFPKSHDVSKALDRQAGAEREVIGLSSITGKRNNSSIDDKAGKENRTFSNTETVLNHKTAPSTDDDKQWEGYGTALKPAYEPICVARKPLDGTIANNVLKHDCGAINLDGCRIGETGARSNGGSTMSEGYRHKPIEKIDYEQGRFPANIIFDELAAEVLDEQSGTLTSGSNCVRRQEGFFIEHGGLGNAGDVQTTYGDTGGASRFFYVAKASKEDRNYGCGDMPLVASGMLSNTSGQHITRRDGFIPKPTKNNHPTVKPISLMRYLVRLVKTPFHTCTIADFFNGSGTTGVACMLEGINFIGCDDDKNSFQISQARTEYAKNEYLKEQAKPKQAKLFNIQPTVTAPIKQSTLF